MDQDFPLKEETYKIIGCCFEVYNEMGNGYLESVYQECLRLEFQKQNIPFVEKPLLRIQYKGIPLEQTYQPDFLCFQDIIIEMKAAKHLATEHQAQVLNYLKTTRKRLGLLINFGSSPKLDYQRLIL